MSSNSWQASLADLLNKADRLAVLGVGSDLRCDDAAGALAARLLLERGFHHCENILVLDVGSAPENATAQLRRFSPHLVLILDAADLGLPPGSARLLEMGEINGVSAVTHGLPLSVLAGYLHHELGCQVALLGIQPAVIDFGEALSEPVKRTIADICDLFEQLKAQK